ncbi:uncharacterized protein LOC143887948 [Tasmannia lanceolata]|uniref:uncharacterized protein LOC143887948 n=1 Tax=Tasmannia lanceolata TaxID=3420 RepID=UPI004063F148
MESLIRLILFLLLISSTSSLNPFSPKASLLRHWSRLFPTNQIPSILLSKSSPLNTTQLALFSNYIDSHTLSSHILSFCFSANLFCDLKDPANITRDITTDADFSVYSNKQFVNYQKNTIDGNDVFTNYSVGQNVARDTFTRYGEDGNSVTGNFRTYSDNTNVAASRFTNYQKDGFAGSDGFSSYGSNSNVQRHDFSSYSQDSSGEITSFSSYSDNSNVVRNGFKKYNSDANAGDGFFTSYAENSNVIDNDFEIYNKGGNGPLDQFTGYGVSGNAVRNDFGSYDGEGNGGLEQFNNYGEGSSSALNGFRSYGKGSNPLVQFTNYGNTTFASKSDFVEYGKDADENLSASFSQYVGNETNFKEYFKTQPTFSNYLNATGLRQSQFKVEAGKFFRQDNLVEGKKIPMPDIRDKLPERSFLPKILADKLPFSSAKLPELVKMLGADGIEPVMKKTVSECERPAVKDETKRCVTSIEAMSEFASSVLGKTATVSTTENTNGWGESLVVGKVVGRNGGKVTRSVSCHQSLFPYLVYYCHEVPRVMVYDVELMDEKSRKKVNEGVGICHMDTTQWGATHAAFVALGSRPGKIEVCHWIFENDLIWVAY